MRHALTASVTVRALAPPATVFGYLVDPARYVTWMGAQARLDPVPGGVYEVRMADGFAAAGQFIAVDPPRKVIFTWGFAGDEAAAHVKHEATSGATMPAGSTRVTVTLEPDADGGTLVALCHESLPNAELRDGHQVAWETYLPRLVIAAAGGDPGPDPHGA